MLRKKKDRAYLWDNVARGKGMAYFSHLKSICSLKLFRNIFTQGNPIKTSFSSKPVASQNTSILTIPIYREAMTSHQINLQYCTLL